MMRRISLALLIIASTQGWGQSIAYMQGEQPEAFVLRNGPGKSELAHPVIETKEWSKHGKAVIAFYEHEGKNESGEIENLIEGFIFLPNTDSTFRKIRIDTFEQEGGPVHIRTVFFESFRKHRKLFVMCEWPQLLHADFGGTIYSTFVYDMPPGQAVDELQIDQKLTKKFSDDSDLSFRDGRSTHAKYKSATAVRRALRRMESAK